MQYPEKLAREKIDALLRQCGWILQNRSTIDLSAGGGIAINVQHPQWSQREAVRHRREALRVKSRRRFHQSAQLHRVRRFCTPPSNPFTPSFLPFSLC